MRDLLDRCQDLIERLHAVQNKLSTAGPTLISWLQREEQFLSKERDALEKAIAEPIDEDPDLRRKSQRLQELKGAGLVLAASILAYLPELGRLPDKSSSSLVGVAPHPRDSGKTRRPRHIRAGRSAVRHVLYMAALTAIRCNPILKDYFLRLRQRDKPSKLCLVAVMRKMLLVLNRLAVDPNFCLAG